MQHESNASAGTFSVPSKPSLAIGANMVTVRLVTIGESMKPYP